MGSNNPVNDAYAAAERTRFNAINRDLEQCFDFASRAEKELLAGNLEQADQNLVEAEKGYATLADLSQAKDLTADVQKEFQQKLNQLRGRLDGLRQSVREAG